MRFRQLGILVALGMIFTFQSGLAQVDVSSLHFEVNQVYTPLSISKDRLVNANTILDLNPRYEADWVKEYIGVEFTVIQKGTPITSFGANDMLTEEQKKLLHNSDVGSEINIKVDYIPENNLKSNEAKVNEFSFIVNPETSASFVGGQDKLNAYLLEKAISKIDDEIFVNYDLAAIFFTVNDQGEIINLRMFEPFKDKEVESILVKAIKNMPCWTPAEYGNGKKVAQDFVLTVGNMANCNINLLNIRKNKS